MTSPASIARPLQSAGRFIHLARYQAQAGALDSAEEGERVPFVIKAEVLDPRAKILAFPRHKTMYGGKHIAAGDAVFVFASEADGGQGLVARAVVIAAKAIPRAVGIARQTPRVSVIVKRTAIARRPLGRSHLKPFADWNDGRPQTELNFKLYRQATNKIIGISDEAATFLSRFF
jgi:hypothetical protein